MPGYHLYRRTNGSGEISDVWWAHFSLGGKLRRVSTGKRDRGEADVRAAALFLEAHRDQRAAVPTSAFDQLGDRELAHVAGAYLDSVEQRIKSGELVRNDSYYDDADRDLRCHILPRFKRAADMTTAAWEDATRAWHAEGVKWRSIQRLP